ncbi:rodlin [Streptomyces sp. L7]
MLKKAMAATAVAASVVGVSATAAPQALAIGNDNGVTTVNGNGAEQVYGNAKTVGDMSPQLGLAQGDLNKLCVGLPAKVNAASIVGILVPVTVLQDVPILSAEQNQQCTENSTQAKGDEPLSHIADNIPVLSGNGAIGS